MSSITPSNGQNGQYPKDFTVKTIAAKQAQTQSALQLAQAQQQAKAQLQQQLARAKAQLQQQLARAKAQGTTDEQLRHMQADAAAQTLKAQSETDAGKSDEPTITIITNGAKNASVTQQLATQMSSKFKESGVNVETSTVHDRDLGSTTGAQMIGQLHSPNLRHERQLHHADVHDDPRRRNRFA